jgi:hypothetical protein
VALKNFFDIINIINNKTLDKLSTEDYSSIEKYYNSFMIVRYYSYFMDTCHIANEINIQTTPEHKSNWKNEFIFLYESIPKGYRVSPKWGKSIKSEEIDLIKEVYGYSTKKAIDVMNLFSKEDIENLRIKLYVGGVDG